MTQRQWMRTFVLSILGLLSSVCLTSACNSTCQFTDPRVSSDVQASAPNTSGNVATNSALLIVEAKLIERLNPTFHCGMFHWVGTHRYEPIKVIGGTHEGGDLFVDIGCPLMPRADYCSCGDVESLAIGDVHHLRLSMTRPASAPQSGLPAKEVPLADRWWAETINSVQ